MKFSELQLEPSLMTSIEKLNFDECTPIQAASLPHILVGKDVAGLAQTGTGKTAAFVIPLIDRILKSQVSLENLNEEQKAEIAGRSFSDWRSQNFILVLVPTRELAEQVFENIQKLGEASGIRGCSVYGGTGYDKQKEAIKNGVQFVVATPGRLIDLYKEHIVDLKQVRAIVFDEADRMFDMGFKDDMKYILQRVPRERQYLVFSATLNFDVTNTAYQFGAEPVEIDVSRDQAKAENVKDEIFHVGNQDKPAYLLSLLRKNNPKQAIIFSNFKHNVDRIARFLSDNGIHAMGISSLLTQAQRTRVMDQFKADNEKNILVATDVAARGLDIKGVDLVVNYDLPSDAESYVHRIGRTGRAGAEGRAFALVSDRDVEALPRIEEYLKHKLPIGWLDDQDLVKDFKPFPSEMNRSFGGGDRQNRPPRGDRGQRPQRGPQRGGGNRQQQKPHHKGPRPQGQHAQGGSPNQQQGGHSQGAKDQRHRQGQNGQGRRHDRHDRHDNRGKHPHQQQGKHGQQQPRRDQQNRRPQHGQKRGAPAQQTGVMQKISKFFKNLFD